MKRQRRAEEQNPNQLRLALLGRPDPDGEESAIRSWPQGHLRHAPKPAEEDASEGPAPPAA